MFGIYSHEGSAYERLSDLFASMTLREWLLRVRRGLRQPRDTSEYAWARVQRRRLLAPVLAILVPLLMIVLVVILSNRARYTTETSTITYVQDPEPAPLDPEQPEILQDSPADDPLPAVAEYSPPLSDPSPTSEGLTTSFISPVLVAMPTAAVMRGPITFDGLLHTRLPQGRQQGLDIFNAPPGTDAAILRALRWLKLHQRPEGSWDGHAGGSTHAESPAALTGLALLTFLAHGDGTHSEEFGDTIERGLRWLVSVQSEDGAFEYRDTHDYAHPICTYALCEALALTRLPALHLAADRATRRILAGQHADGGWDYNLKGGDRNDLSYSAWCIQALKAAQMARPGTPGIDQALTRAASGVERFQTRSNGRFGYSDPGNGSGGLTGAGVLCLQLLGHSRSPAVQAGLRYMDPWVCRWGSPDNPSPLYYWYYATQAKFHAGKAVWNQWNAQFSVEYLRQQRVVADAIATPSGALADVGYWEPSNPAEHGRSYVYNTTLCALTLQVYYRMLPTYMESAIREVEKQTFEDQPGEITLISIENS